MKIILRVSGDPDGVFDVDYALVKIDAILAKTIVHRAEIIAEVRKKNSDLFKMSYWHGAPTYFSAGAEENHKFFEEAYHDGWAHVPDDYTVKEESMQRTECDLMVLSQVTQSEPSVHWTCIPKHGDITLETADIPLSLIKEALPGQCGGP